jgi:FAD/FMN-containing dehydrogenase
MIVKKDLEEIVGSENVCDDPQTLKAYAHDQSFVPQRMPEYIVKPNNGTEIQALVKWANETLTPLVPVSSGPPHFHGDTVPSTGGAIIVDLSSMKKIIRIDRPNRVVMCEPGVTFKELIPAVEKDGLRLNLPLLPRETKSVIGSLLEREPVIMPCYHWDIADPLDCVEIIFGTGDMFRTGGAAGPGTIEEQLAAGGAQDEPLGPGQADWYRAIQGAQGTLGITTWASMRCELLPKVEEPFIVGSTQMDKLLELVHWLIRLRLVNECFVLNNCNLSAILAKKWPDHYLNIKDTLPPWVLFFNIVGYDYLPEERVKYQITDMLSTAQRVGLEPVKRIGSVSAKEILQLVQRTSKEPYWKLRFKGACHDIFFLTIYDSLPELIGVMYDTADKAVYPASDIGIYLQPLVQGTNCHCEFNFYYDPKNLRESERVKDLSASATKKLIAGGAFFSRPYGENSSMIINRDAATASALHKIKMIFDPKKIMNPGKLCF